MMKISTRALFNLGVAAAALTATPAFAQQSTADTAPQVADSAGNDLSGEIVVTARRREESLLEVPIAITAFSGATLEKQGALDITDVGNTTPNVTLEVSRGSNSTLSAFIRGVGQQDPVAGFEQGVGIYLDDVYLNRPQAAVLDIYDVERIEVLRGPQGTLYGRNTIGGAVKYVTRRLSADPTVSLRANLGTYQQADVIASASTGVGSGLLRFGGSVARLSRGGFGKNLTTGLENYNKDIWAGRLSAEINNESTIFVRLSADYTDDQSAPRGGHRLIPSFVSNTPVLSNVFDSQGGLLVPDQSVRAGGISLYAEVKPQDWLTLRSISAYRKDKTRTPIDFDALPAADLDVPGIYNNRQFSQELQALVDTGSFHGLVGGYFLDADAVTAFDVRLFTTVPGLAAFTDAKVHTETYAIFGDFTYDFTDQFSLSAGGRYTRDRRQASILRQNYLGGGAAIFGGAAIPFGAPSTNFTGARVFNKFTPRASLSFRPTPDHNLYVSYSKGFKGGGFDPRGVGANAPDTNGNGIRDQQEVATFLSFLPETVDSYEAGYKGSLLDHRLNVALAVFRADYKNEQIPGSAGCVVNGIQTFCGVTTNAGKVRFQGVEFEGSAKLANDFAVGGDALTLSGSLGYIDPKFKQYDTFVAGRGTVDVTAFRHVQNTPKWTASGTLDYTAPVWTGTIDLNTTVSYRSKTYQFEIANPFIDQPGFALWDANLVYRAEGDRWSIGVHAKNLTNKKYKTSGYTFLAADPVTGALLTDKNGKFISALGKEGTLTAFYGNPRQVFVTLGVKF
ncbi:putative TonB-dependent receptor [Sphingomonas changbaiensis NBRC 104936]|uniref:Putative TonB-dependent receptor n=2 Tax=Sphingomonas changbaiensis TaxID=529705 RepID=A0A0E9MRM9_9SPHN|nr:putative TonB-dependent receptor [Sphingomonas changbaiensis NBRC 104936]